MMRELCCAECGAEGHGTCDCNAPYVPRERAMKYAEENPTKSVSQIAEATGVSRATAGRAKKATVSPETVTIGKDNKVRPRPKAKVISLDQRRAINEFHREAVDFFDAFERRFRQWHQDHSHLDDEGKDCLKQAFLVCVDGFERLVHLVDDEEETQRACASHL